jgi:hypothetical protein
VRALDVKIDPKSQVVWIDGIAFSYGFFASLKELAVEPDTYVMLRGIEPFDFECFTGDELIAYVTHGRRDKQ